MNTSPTAYTPLETLLLFQSLTCYGLEGSVYSKISELLNRNPHITNADQYDSGRLSPDALRNLVRNLLNDESEAELRNGDATASDAPNGGGHENSKKRKAPSPGLPTVKEASQNKHLIPKLVAKLYVRYREQVVTEVREDERLYDKLQKELVEIEKGEWDKRLQETADHAAKPTDVQKEASDNLLSKRAHSANAAPGTDLGIRQDDATPQINAPRSTSFKPPSSQDGTRIEMPSSNFNGVNVAPDSVAIKSSVPEEPSAPAVPSNIGAPPLPSTSRKPIVHPSPLPHASSSQSGHRSPSTPNPGQIASNVSQKPAQSSTKPNIAPAQGAPIIPAPTLNQNGVQYSAPHSQTVSTPSSTSHKPSKYPSQISQKPLAPHTPQSAPQQRNYYHPYPGAQSQPSTTQQIGFHPPRQGGFMLPPFQVAPQDPTRAHQQQQKSTQQAHTPPRPLPTKLPVLSPATKVAATPSVQPSPVLTDVLRLLHVTSPRSDRVPKRMSLQTLSTPSSVTRWKTPASKFEGDVKPSPPVSPIDDVSSLQDLPPPPKTRGRRGGRRGGAVHQAEVASDFPQDASPRPARGRRRGGLNARGGSAVSSALGSSGRTRTRSHSVHSYDDAMSVDEGSLPGQVVKPEPNTPAASTEEDHQMTESSPNAGPRTRHRAATLQYLPVGTNKRKRAEPDTASEIADSDGLPSPGPQQIVATRNFARMSVPIMNNIASHKHASLFSNPVKEKDAEGYYDIIRRPQDLKSIRVAINAGTRAVNAALAGPTTDQPNTTASTPGGPAAAHTPNPSGVSSPGTFVTSGGGATASGRSGDVFVPLAADFMPPKGIVNAAQLERELARVFANAVMFNTGDGEVNDVVSDAREMFDDVQAALSSWRSAERRSSVATLPDVPTALTTPTPAGPSTSQNMNITPSGKARATSNTAHAADTEPSGAAAGPPATPTEPSTAKRPGRRGRKASVPAKNNG